jgi:hypothetical protein
MTEMHFAAAKRSAPVEAIAHRCAQGASRTQHTKIRWALARLLIQVKRGAWKRAQISALNFCPADRRGSHNNRRSNQGHIHGVDAEGEVDTEADARAPDRPGRGVDDRGRRLNLPSDMSKATSPGAVLVGWRVTGIGMLMAFVHQGLATRKPGSMPAQGHLDRMSLARYFHTSWAGTPRAARNRTSILRR